jgi:hypothetical protein
MSLIIIPYYFALFMRLFRLRKAFSASLAVSKVRSEDCIPSLTNSTYLSLFAVSTRQQYVVEFMAEHQMYTKEMGPTFINAKGKDCTSIDYILFRTSCIIYEIV